MSSKLLVSQQRFAFGEHVVIEILLVVMLVSALFHIAKDDSVDMLQLFYSNPWMFQVILGCFNTSL